MRIFLQTRFSKLNCLLFYEIVTKITMEWLPSMVEVEKNDRVEINQVKMPPLFDQFQSDLIEAFVLEIFFEQPRSARR